MTRFGKTLLAGAVALACVAGTASAQFSNFYSFGDSLSDVGTLRGLPIFPPEGGVATTNPGPLWTQLVAERYGLTSTPAVRGGNNFAYLGARVAENPGMPSTFPPTASATPIRTQISQFLARGPVDAGALYSVWGGGNDVFRQLELFAGGQITQAQLQANIALAASQLAGGVAQLQTAGAGTIVVLNLPDVGKSPFGTGSGQSATLSAISGLYNSTLSTGLNQAGGNVIRVDAFGLFNDIIANPSRYGFTNTTGMACTSVAAGQVYSPFCTRQTLVSPTAPQTYVFADDAHPTEAVHAVVAQVVASMIEAPSTAATLTQGPLAVEQATWRTVDARMWSAMDTPYDPKRGMNFWAAYDYSNPDIDTGFATGDADLNTLSVGGDMRIGQNWLVGAAANFSGYKATYSGGGHKLNETSGSIYGGWGHGPWYAGASALIGALDYSDVDRSFAVGNAQREESGRHLGHPLGVPPARRVLAALRQPQPRPVRQARLAARRRRRVLRGHRHGHGAALRPAAARQPARQPGLAGPRRVGCGAAVRARDLGVRVQRRRARGDGDAAHRRRQLPGLRCRRPTTTGRCSTSARRWTSARARRRSARSPAT